MLSRLRSPRLCQGCRNDLLSVFDYASGGAFKPGAFLLPSLIIPSQTDATRRFSNTRLRQKEVKDRPAALNSSNSGDADLSEPTVIRSDAALKGERKTRPAVEDHRPSQSLIGDAPEGHSLEATDQYNGHEAVQESVPTLRLSGANTESVVREARQRFGESLPEDVLSKHELKLYRRLYDDPLQGIAEDAGDISGTVEDDTPDCGKATQSFDNNGQPVQRTLDGGAGRKIGSEDDEDYQITGSVGNSSVMERQSAVGQQQSADAVQRGLGSDQAQHIAEELGGEVYYADTVSPSNGDEDTFSSNHRVHPLTSLGRFATYPRTVYLPQEAIIKPVEHLLSDYSNKHLKEVCERTFGGGGLPNSPLTPRSGRTTPQVPVPLQASQHSMSEMEANAFMTVIMPSTYATVSSVLVEIRKRLGTSWLNRLLAQDGGPRVLDAGAGGAGIMAWRDVVRAEWGALHSSDRNPPLAPVGKATVLTGSDTLRHRSAALLENTTFIPRLPDYVHIRDAPTLEDDRPVSQRKEFDIVIASHTLWPFKEDWERKQHIQNLWSLLSPEGGVLILVEKGVPRGFEAIAGARELLLERYIASPGSQTYHNSLESPLSDESPHTQKGKGMIIAPCTNHNRCPMYPVAGMSRGRKDYCSFQQRYIRPQFLQRILGAKDRSHDDVDFSYISVLKGQDLREHSATSFGELKDPSSAPQSSSSEHPMPDQVTDQAFEGFEHVEASVEDEPNNAMTTTGAFESGGSLPSLRDLPRLVYPPLKRRGHVTLDVCTPAGKIERWTVPKSYSKQAYRDARKSNWGDLWALGAKTRVVRNLRLGGPGTKEGMKVRSQRNRMMDKAAELAERMEEEKLADIEDVEELEREMQSGADDISAPDMWKKTNFHQPTTEQTLVEDDVDDQEDVEVARALAEWEEEFEHDKRIGRKSVRSVREGTKPRRQTPRMAPVWHGSRDRNGERYQTRD
jgi:ribosomal protein RSM22 (predicted rRNA methylase)